MSETHHKTCRQEARRKGGWPAASTVQTIESFVGEAMDEARMGSIHWRVLALVADGYFFDVLDFTIFGALVPDLLRSGFVKQSRPAAKRWPIFQHVLFPRLGAEC